MNINIETKHNPYNLLYKHFILPSHIKKVRKIIICEELGFGLPKIIKNIDDVYDILGWKKSLFTDVFIRDLVSNKRLSVKEVINKLYKNN
jgi:hypothetical protein